MFQEHRTGASNRAECFSGLRMDLPQPVTQFHGIVRSLPGFLEEQRPEPTTDTLLNLLPHWRISQWCRGVKGNTCTTVIGVMLHPSCSTLSICEGVYEFQITAVITEHPLAKQNRKSPHGVRPQGNFVAQALQTPGFPVSDVTPTSTTKMATVDSISRPVSHPQTHSASTCLSETQAQLYTASTSRP